MTAQIVHGSVWRLVREQHGVISRGQLLALGYTSGAIKHRIVTGRLHPIWRGVYVVGRPEATQRGRWMAAILSCGPCAALSDRSAAALWEIRPYRGRAVHVSLPTRLRRRRSGIVVRRRADNLTTHRHGIPVTPPAETLVDLAMTATRSELEAAINEADKLDLIDPERLRAAVENMRARPGRRALRDILDAATFTMTDTELERRFLPLARAAGLPPPETQQYVNGHRVDFFWPNLALVVETDGLRYHRTPAQQARDRIRDQDHARAGLTPLRFTHAQIAAEPARVRAILVAVVAERAARARSA